MPVTGNERTEKLGAAWLDVDLSGCGTRNDILQRDFATMARSGPCKVTSGVLVSPYPGETINFVRGNKTSRAVQVDHVVAPANAGQTGARQLSQEQRIALAIEPLNLFAVDGSSNLLKGAGDAATWLPNSFRCTYVSHQVSIKAAYGLWVTKAEHEAMTRVLSSCADARSPVVDARACAGGRACSHSDACRGELRPELQVLVCRSTPMLVVPGGNRPSYVRGPVTVVGVEIYDLDRDGDGRAC